MILNIIIMYNYLYTIHMPRFYSDIPRPKTDRTLSFAQLVACMANKIILINSVELEDEKFKMTK